MVLWSILFWAPLNIVAENYTPALSAHQIREGVVVAPFPLKIARERLSLGIWNLSKMTSKPLKPDLTAQESI